MEDICKFTGPPDLRNRPFAWQGSRSPRRPPAPRREPPDRPKKPPLDEPPQPMPGKRDPEDPPPAGDPPKKRPPKKLNPDPHQTLYFRSGTAAVGVSEISQAEL